MPRDGSGGYDRYTPGTPYVNGTTIDETVVNAEMDDLGNEVANSIAKNGETVPTNNLPMGGYKHTGVGDASARDHYAAAGQVQKGSFVYATVGGTADAITFTLSPAPAAYIAGLRWTAKATAANTGAATGNLNSLGNKDIKRPNGDALQAGDISNGGLIDLEYDGTNIVLLNPATVKTQTAGDNSTKPASTAYVDAAATTVLGGFRNLALSATGSDANVSISYDALAVENSSNVTAVLRSGSLTINTTTTGANGLDTGTLATSTWYSVWVIYNGSAAAGLISTSASSPTMPGGYTFRARVGWIRTDSTGSKHPFGFTQNGRRVQYRIGAGLNLTAPPTIISGNSGTPGTSLTATSVSNYVPATAATIVGSLYQESTGNLTVIAQVAPNAFATMGGGNGVFLSQSINTSYANQQAQFEFILESTSIYYAASGSGTKGVVALGWEDNL